MKNIKRLSIYATLLATHLVFSGTTAFAQEEGEEEAVTGRELLADCELGEPSLTPNRVCMQYVFGLVQTVVMLQQMDPDNKLFCIDPTVVGLEEVTNKVKARLKAVPDRLDEDAYVLVSEALNISYPCAAADIF